MILGAVAPMPEAAPLTVASWVRDVRRQHGLTIEKFAHAVGVVTSTVVNWERERLAQFPPQSFAKVAAWCDRMGVAIPADLHPRLAGRDRRKVLATLRKLIIRAFGDDAEAVVAREKAQTLMTRHRLTLTDLAPLVLLCLLTACSALRQPDELSIALVEYFVAQSCPCEIDEAAAVALARRLPPTAQRHGEAEVLAMEWCDRFCDLPDLPQPTVDATRVPL